MYCVVGRGAPSRLADSLRRHYRDDASVEVLIERRNGDRRRCFERRTEGSGAPSLSDERRTIHNHAGRRIAQRRAVVVFATPLPVPRWATHHAADVSFVERIEPSGRVVEDIETDRLITRIQGGERSAFSELYLLYEGRVHAFLQVALRDGYEAQDLSQQVFLRVLEALPQYRVRPDQPFRPWLFRIVRNHVSDHLRKQGWVEVEEPARLDALRDTPREQDDLHALQWLSDSDVLMFIERLPLIQRQVLTLQYMMDLGISEIADVLERSPESVRQLRHRALRFLEERLTAMGRRAVRSERAAMWRVPRQAIVLRSRRFALL